MKRTILIGTLVIIAAFAVWSGLSATPADVNAAAATDVPSAAKKDFTFEGCWSWTPAGTCRDVFQDSEGGHWLCKACGQTNKPGQGQCSSISQRSLDSGYWCS